MGYQCPHPQFQRIYFKYLTAQFLRKVQAVKKSVA